MVSPHTFNTLPCNKNRGFVLTIIGPSGSGKTSIKDNIVEGDSKLVSAITATTRPPRADEVQGTHYYFKTQDEFQTMIEDGDLLEYVTTFKNKYGTPRASVEDKINTGLDVALIIDWKGHLSLKESMPEDIVSVFIAPPSFKELEARIRKRATDSEDVIKRRLSEAQDDMTHSDDCHYIVVNDNLESAIEEVQCIIKREREKRFLKSLPPTTHVPPLSSSSEKTG